MPDEPDPTRRDPDAHARILAATVDLLEDTGYAALTVEGIARAAGVGKQTIYRWWGGSLPDLVLEAFAGTGDERVALVDSGTVAEDLRAVLAQVFALHRDLRSGTALANRTMMAQAQLDVGFHERYVDLHRGWWGPMLAAVERGVERGELRADTDPQVVVDLLLGAAWYRLLLEHAPLDEALADELVTTVLDGRRP